MVIVKLMGGLGNQMFQYAAGRSLAHRLKTTLKLDLSSYENQSPNDTPRHYALGCFQFKTQFASKREIPSSNQKTHSFLDKLPPTVQKLLRYNSMTIVKEKHYHFDPEFLSLRGNIYLEGYWQSEKYFKPIANTIHQDFTFKKPPTGKNRELAEKIKKTKSVSIHVRRSDYVMDKTTNKYHGCCSLGYYRRCLGFIAKRLRKPIFLAFSDDPSWTRKNLKTKFPITYVIHNQDRGWEDLRLMSLCQHHILANSSFSWWAAWLNQYPGKVVLAPNKWFNQAPYDTKDLYLPGWIRI